MRGSESVANKKRMTNREKQLKAKMKKDMQDRGLIPPDKPKLNRKKFIDEAGEEWNSKDKDCYIWDIYLYEAISIMLGHIDKNLRASPEAVGVAKCLKLAIRLREFSNKLEAEGRKTYTLKEKADYIEDILKA